MRDDVQYYRDLYNLDRVEALKGPNAMMFGRGGGGGVVNRVTKEAGFTPIHEITLLGGSYGNKRFTADLDQPLSDKVALRLNAMYENSDSFRKYVNLERHGINPTLTYAARKKHEDHAGLREFPRRPRGRSRHHLVPGQAGGCRHRPHTTAIRTKVTCGARVNLGSATVEHQAGRADHSQSDDGSAITTAAIRTLSPAP